MKKIMMLVWALVALVGVTTFTGCATAINGTGRPLPVSSSIPGTELHLTTANGREEVKIAPAVFHLSTFSDRGDMRLVAIAPDGRYIERVLTWENKDGKWFMAAGGIGWGVTTGVGGLVSLGTDYVTKSYKDLSESSVHFDFDMVSWQKNVAPSIPRRAQLRVPPPTLPPADDRFVCPQCERNYAHRHEQRQSDGEIRITITREYVQ